MPAWFELRGETGDIGSNHCSGCKENIERLIDGPRKTIQING